VPTVVAVIVIIIIIIIIILAMHISNDMLIKLLHRNIDRCAMNNVMLVRVRNCPPCVLIGMQ
jgi:uncharacterized membrane protein YvbJ